MKKILIIILCLPLIGATQYSNIYNNIVIQHVLSSPDGLHPYNDNSVTRSSIFQYTQKTLIKLDLETLDYFPQLVEDLPEVSEDGLQYTYYIKKGIKWDDGSEFTAKDVEFSTKLMLCPLTDNSQIRSNYSSVIKSIETFEDNPYKFIMHAHKIHVSNKFIFSELYMQQKSLWDEEGTLDQLTFEDIHNPYWTPSTKIDDWFLKFNSPRYSYIADNLVGLGPYQVTEFETDQYITIERKNNWWGKNDTSKYNVARPDKIIFQVVSDYSIVDNLINENIDIASLNPKIFPKLKNQDIFNDNYVSALIDRFNYSYIGLNMKPDGIKHKKFFVDQRVRRAMAYLTPVDKIIDVIQNGHASRQTSIISPLKKTYNDTLKEIPYDIEAAKKLLDEAGWIDTDGDNIRDKVIDGVKTQFSFNFSYMSAPPNKSTALMLQKSMGEAGLELIPTPMDFSLFYERAQNHEFDMMLGGWGGSASYSDPRLLWHTDSWATKGSNFCGFGDAESDALIEEANTSLDYNKHKDALWRLQAKIYNDQPYIFLFASKNKIAIHRRFQKEGESDDEYISRTFFIERPHAMLNNLQLNKNYTHNKKDGAIKLYHENNNLWYKVNFKNDKRDGLSKIYYENGKILENSYWKGGVPHGLSKTYYENGEISGEGFMYNGNQDGIWKFYSENGKLEFIYEYTSGELNIYKEYNISGNLIYMSRWRDGIRESSCSYHKNGKIKREIIFTKYMDVERETCWDKIGREINCIAD